MSSAPETADHRTELLLRQLEHLPTLPAVALRILELTAKPDTTARQIVSVIESDPSLTARILRIVHRADGGVRGDVNSIERAVVLLGFEAVRNAALAVGVFETFGPGEEPVGKTFSREAFWKHCVAVAAAAEAIAESIRKSKGHSAGVDPGDAFVAGLLHDIGKVALDAAIPKSFARIVDTVEKLRADIADVERTVVGLDHMIVGKRLAERWMLPAALRDAIWLHNQHPEALPQGVRNATLINVVTLADQIARRQYIGFSGNHTYAVPTESLLEAIGLKPQQLNQISAELVSRIEPRARSLGLEDAGGDAIYRQAIVRANEELGRVTDQLEARNRKLTVRAKFFEALAQFHEALRPDAPMPEVLFAIAQTATSSLDVPVAGAFSFSADGLSVDIMIVERDGTVRHQGVVERASNVAAAESQQESVDAIETGINRLGDSFEWLRQAVSPVVAGPDVFWMPLRADGVCVGGVLWGASVDEMRRLSSQKTELAAMTAGWSLSMRTSQIRDESRRLAEQLADANRRLIAVQDQVLRARTLVSIAEMAAGAAHEMNNPLTVIAGRAQLLSSKLNDPQHAASAKLIAEQAASLSDIITELMHFAKPASAKPAVTPLKDLIARAIEKAERIEQRAGRSVVNRIGNDVACIVDPDQLSDALAEVIANAYQATDANAGHITIEAGIDRAAGRVMLTLSDDGVGMNAATLAKAFDPFFSARPAGRRRGMGLAKAQRLIEASGGMIRLESAPGQGTRAFVQLVCAQRAVKSNSSTPSGQVA